MTTEKVDARGVTSAPDAQCYSQEPNVTKARALSSPEGRLGNDTTEATANNYFVRTCRTRSPRVTLSDIAAWCLFVALLAAIIIAFCALTTLAWPVAS